MPGTISPTAAAETLGISAPLLRQLAGTRYFADLLEAPRDVHGHRQYTERDIALLRSAIQRQKRGISYDATKQAIRIKGADKFLREELGNDGAITILEETIDRLRLENKELLDRNGALQQEEAAYQKARALAAVAIQSAGTSRRDMLRSLQRAEMQYVEALAHLNALQSSFLTRLFGSARLAAAIVQLKEAERSRQEAYQAVESFSMAPLVQALQLAPTRDHQDVVDIEAPSQKEEEPHRN